MIYRLEKPLSKMLEEKACICYLRSTSFSQIPLLQFTFLSGNDHIQENEGNPIFEPIQIFDNEDVVNVVNQKNISDCLVTMNNSSRILTSKMTAIYQVFS